MDIFPSEMSAFIGNTSATVRRPPVSVSYSTVDPIRTTFPWCRRVRNHACPFELGQGTIGNIGKAISRGERKFVQSLVINIAHHDRRLSPGLDVFLHCSGPPYGSPYCHASSTIGPRWNLVDRPSVAPQNRHHLVGRPGQPEALPDQRRPHEPNQLRKRGQECANLRARPNQGKDEIDGIEVGAFEIDRRRQPRKRRYGRRSPQKLRA